MINGSNMAERVHATMMACLYKPDEIVDGKAPADAVMVEGLVATYGFHPQRLQRAKPDVIEMIGRLHDNFTKGGGWTFLNMCQDRDGELWGEQRTCESLFCLAKGLGLADYCMPREYWGTMPGGLPYVSFKVGAQ